MADKVEKRNVDVMFAVSEAYRLFNAIDATWRHKHLGKLQGDLVNAGLDKIEAVIFIQKLGFDYSDWDILDMWKDYLVRKEIQEAVDMGYCESPSGEW